MTQAQAEASIPNFKTAVAVYIAVNEGRSLPDLADIITKGAKESGSVNETVAAKIRRGELDDELIEIRKACNARLRQLRIIEGHLPDSSCPECARSYGPHYKGPCEH